MPPFQEAVDWFLGKIPLSRAEFDRLSAAAKTKAFTAAYVLAADRLQAVYDVCLTALEKGETLHDFRKRTEDILRRSWHRETVFRTNVLSAYGAGHWQQAQQTKEVRPYARYSAVMDGRTRPSHARLHGLVYPLDHPFWQLYWPPWDYNCRCAARTLSAGEVESQGLMVQQGNIDDLPRPKNDFVSPTRGGEWQPDFSRYAPELAGQVRQVLGGAKVDPDALEIGRGVTLPGIMQAVYRDVHFYRGPEIGVGDPRFARLVGEAGQLIDKVERETGVPFVQIVRDIRVWNRPYPFDALLQAATGRTEPAALTGGKGVISIWQAAWGKYPFDGFDSLLAHEWGHNLAWRTSGRYAPGIWGDLTEREGWVSAYSRKYADLRENFADTAMLYLTRGEKALAKFPGKLTYLKAMLEVLRRGQ